MGTLSVSLFKKFLAVNLIHPMFIGSFFSMPEKGSARTAVTKGCSTLHVLIVMAVCVFGTLTTGNAASAQLSQSTTNVQTIATTAGVSASADLPTIVGRVIYVALGLVGIVLIGLLLFAGFLWMTAGGEMEKVEKARTYIRNAIIGLVIIASAFAITRFILSQLQSIDGYGGVTGSGPGRGFGFPSSSGSLGGGIIESHVPPRNATNIPRNTPIVITFKEPIKLTSMIAGWNDAGTPNDITDDPTGLNDAVMKIFPTSSTITGALRSATVRVRYTPDRKTFVLRPVDPLGSPTIETPYTVKILSGSAGLLRDDGTSPFTGAFSSGYEWSFQVSRVMDLTPPQVVSVIPFAGGVYAPNIVLQINFNERIDPTTASSTSIEVMSTPLSPPGSPSSRVRGEFKPTNDYSTIEFVTDLPCGVNSCGRQIFCLPSSSTISVIVRAATLSSDPPQAELTRSGYDGIVDMVGNSLDGNANGRSEGSASDRVPGDDAYGLAPVWRFGTTDRPNLVPPIVRATMPQTGNHTEWRLGTGGSSRIPLDLPPQADFDSILQTSTLTSDTVLIQNNEAPELRDTFWWTVHHQLLNATGDAATSTSAAVAGRVFIKHRLYLPATSTALGAIAPEYYPFYFSGIQNIYQNCFNPSASDRCVGPFCCDGRASTVVCPYPLVRP